MSYNRVNWENYPNKATPINATNLNIMDKGINDLYTPTKTNVTVQYGSASATIQFAKAGILVFSNSFTISASVTQSTWQEIGQLPTDLQPLYDIQTFAQNIVEGKNPPKVRITTDGKIYIAKYLSSGSADWYFQIPLYMSNK